MNGITVNRSKQFFLMNPMRPSSRSSTSRSSTSRSSTSRSSTSRSFATTTGINTNTNTTTIPQPSKIQLRNHYIANGLPMVGFGLMDQTVLIQAGNMIDCTIGVQFGLSTLTAAAVGGLISNLSGVLFGGTLEALAIAWGLPSSNLTGKQRSLPFVKRGRVVSQAVGIFLGCCLGLVNLLFIDTEKSSSLKLLNKTEEEEFAFEVEVSNDTRDDATVLVVTGPDLDGVLAGVTAALTLNGCSLLEVSAHSDKSNSSSNNNNNSSESDKDNNVIIDTFVVVDQITKKKIKDEDLEQLGRIILEASREGPNLLKYQVKELEEKNHALQDRVQSLETILLKRRMSVKPSGKGIVRS